MKLVEEKDLFCRLTEELIEQVGFKKNSVGEYENDSVMIFYNKTLGCWCAPEVPSYDNVKYDQGEINTLFGLARYYNYKTGKDILVNAIVAESAFNDS
jgi:hypothetical protein